MATEYKKEVCRILHSLLEQYNSSNLGKTILLVDEKSDEILTLFDKKDYIDISKTEFKTGQCAKCGVPTFGRYCAKHSK